MSNMASTSSKPPIDEQTRYRQLVRYSSLVVVVAAPILLFMPPRKFDIYTVGLICGTAFSGNELLREYTGRSIVDRLPRPHIPSPGEDLPSDRAREVQQLLKAEKEERKRIRGELENAVPGEMVAEGEVSKALREKAETEKRGVLQKAWFGNEGSDWKAKRDQRERDALKEGRSYGDLIMDQIWEVFNWGETPAEKVKEDEKILQERATEKKKD